MKLTTRLTQFVLRQALGELGSQSVYWLQQHFTDPTQALPAAIDEANTRTWHVLELALTGDSFTGWLRQKLAKGAERGILVPLREWLKGQGEPFLCACLTELRAAGAAGMLTTDNTGQELLADWGVAGVANQAAVAADASLLLNEISRDLQDYYPNLALFLAGPDVNLLPAIFGYFLRQAVLERPELKEALNFERLAQVWQGQMQGFTDLNNLLTEHSAAVMERLAQFGLGFNELTQHQVEIKEMLQQIHARLPNSARTGGVSPRLSSMLRSASDVRLLTELEQRLNNLPPVSITPQVLDAVGRLAMAVGIFPTAQQHFAQAATLAHANGASNIEAEAHYNTYRALLEQRQFDTALTALQAAVSLAPAKFAPFPMDKYLPQRILGAGGFGVSFLCQHLHLDELIVIKTLYTEELERNIAEIFREGRILRKLRHPSIIEVTDCDYAGAQQQRPFVVMEYFAGQSLAEYLQQQGVLPLEQALALARLLAEALLAAHQLNIWHRDVKPDNVLVQRQENSWQIKVIDFGLAIAGKRILHTVATGNASQSLLGLSVGGTFQYSAPEQLETLPGGKIGPWSDVYAFGKTLSYALFKTTQPSQKNYRALGEHWFGDLLSDCMEQHPAERPQDFVEVLRRWPSDEPVKPLPSTSSGNVFKPLQPLPPLPPLPSSRKKFEPEMILVKAGKFIMGSPKLEQQQAIKDGASEDWVTQETQHEVIIERDFWLGKYAITFDEYDAFCEAIKCDKPSDKGWGRGRRPVINVSWNDAMDYCAWLSQQTGKNYRLPTEAEWEYACRAGTTGAFSFAEPITTDKANYDGNYTYNGSPKGQYRQQTVPVDSFQPNPWGFYQMHGNVWEWTGSEYKNPYDGSENKLVSKDHANNSRVLRGGSWYYGPRILRSASRSRNSDDDRLNANGVRLVST